MHLGRGDSAPLVLDPRTQQTLVNTQFPGNFGDRATRIDHTMRSLDLVLGRERPTLARRHEDILSTGLVILSTRCPLPRGNLRTPSGSNDSRQWIEPFRST